MPVQARRPDKRVSMEFSLTAKGASNSRIVEDDQHGKYLFHCIKTLWKEGFLTDYTLIAEGAVFQVHRIVLAATCDYFKAAFRSGMLEVLSDTSELKGVSATGLREIVDFLYTGKLKLSRRNIGDVLSGGIFLQCQSVIQLCCRFLISRITLDTYSEIRTIALGYSLEEVSAALHTFSIKHFVKFARSVTFKQLSLSEVSQLISDDKLRCYSEYKLLKLVVGWVNYDRAARENLSAVLLQHVRFGLMSSQELSTLRKLRVLIKEPITKSYLEEAMYFQAHSGDASTHVVHTSPRTQVRGEDYVITFGCTDQAMHSCVYFKKKWFTLNKALGQPKPFINASAAVVNNDLFVCGGGSPQWEAPSRACYSYNIHTSRWTRLAKMKKPRRNFALVPHQAKLFAFGGLTGEEGVTDTVEVYCIESNRWEIATHMDKCLTNLAACSYKDTMYTAGGLDDQCMSTKDFRMYSPLTNSWEKKPDILNIKFQPKMFSVRKHVYLVDLYRTDGVPAQLERYNPAAEQWTKIILRELHFTRCFGAEVLGDWIYFVGKNSVDDGRSKRYNILTGTLEDIASYPWDVDSPLCCTLRIPYKLLHKKIVKDDDTIAFDEH